jgi:hypothetical protein
MKSKLQLQDQYKLHGKGGFAIGFGSAPTNYIQPARPADIL